MVNLKFLRGQKDINMNFKGDTDQRLQCILNERGKLSLAKLSFQKQSMGSLNVIFRATATVGTACFIIYTIITTNTNTN